MALPVYQIMAQLQEGVDAKGAEAEEKGELDFVLLSYLGCLFVPEVLK